MAWSHNGELDNALKLLDAAEEAGADAIGIHITSMNDYMVQNYKCIAGQTLSSGTGLDNEKSIFEALKNLNLKNEDWLFFDQRIREKKIDLIVMANDLTSFNFSKKLNVSAYVLSPASFQEYQLLREVAFTQKPVYLRTGGASLKEVHEVVGEIRRHTPSIKIILLAGIQLYPTPVSELRLKSLYDLRKEFTDSNLEIGLADHIDGDNKHAKHLPALALGFGATVLEKHITTNRTEKLEDYEAALGTKEFEEFVDFVRAAELAIGSSGLDYMNHINDAYKKYREVSRKKIVALGHIKHGETINSTNITLKRSDEGLDMSWYNKIIGYRATCEISNDGPILMSNIGIINSK